MTPQAADPDAPETVSGILTDADLDNLDTVPDTQAEAAAEMMAAELQTMAAAAAGSGSASTAPADANPGVTRALRELDSPALRSLVSEIGIPPWPRVLRKLRKELDKDDPRLHKVEEYVGSDVALSAALMRTANSALFGLTRRAETIEQAFMLLGLNNCQALFTEILMRRLLPADGPTLNRFWDVSEKRSRAMTYLARTRRVVPTALAHTTGLFLDVGVPLLARRFPGPQGYLATYAKANESLESFTAVEQAQHKFNHALVGAMAALSWGVSHTAVLAVRLHHEYHTWANPLPPQVGELMGLALVSEHIVQRYEDVNRHLEWEKGGHLALRLLKIDERELYDWCDEVHHHFDANARS